MKKLQKGIDFIIFKEGKNKTVEFALDKNIKLVNPLFIHESEIKGELQNWEQFEIKKSYTELNRISKMNSLKSNDSVGTIFTKNESENKKRKFDQAFPILLKNEESFSKKIKNNYSNIKSNELINKESHENTKLQTEKKSYSTIKNQEMNKSENKITNFFRPTAKSEIKSNQDSKNIFFENPILNNIQTVEKSVTSCYNSKSDLIKISSISLGEEGKFKINSCVKLLGKYIYVGESLENISQSEFVVVNDTFNKIDLKYIYCLFYNKKIISLNFFTDSKNQNQYKFHLEDFSSFHKSSNVNEEEQEQEKKLYNFYLKNFPINLKSLEEKKINKDFPFKEDKYKIYLHPSLYEKDLIKKEVYVKILEFLGLEMENNIRLSDICILNKEDLNEHFPGHVRLINESFLFDCFFNWKVMNIENMKYFPEKIKFKN